MPRPKAKPQLQRPFVSKRDPFSSTPDWLSPEDQAIWHRYKSVLKCDDYAGHSAYSCSWILRQLIKRCQAEIEQQGMVVAGQKGVLVPNPNVLLMTHLIHNLDRLHRLNGFTRIDKDGGRGSDVPVPAGVGIGLDDLIKEIEGNASKVNRRSGMHRDAINPRRKEKVT